MALTPGKDTYPGDLTWEQLHTFANDHESNLCIDFGVTRTS